MSLLKKLDSQKTEPSHGGAGMMRWLLTYADLITLLLAFFIVMYAISKVDVERYQQLARALSQIFHGGGSGLFLPEGGEGIDNGELPAELADLSEGLAAFLSQQGLGDQVFITRTSEGIIISFTGSVLFDSGQADLRPATLPVLDKIAGYLKAIPNFVGVAGSTDDLPINTPFFPSNWELSVVRATTVIRYLTEKGGLDPSRFVALGFGEYRPLFPNDTEEGRRKNRRVDVIIYYQNPFSHKAAPGL